MAAKKTAKKEAAPTAKKAAVKKTSAEKKPAAEAKPAAKKAAAKKSPARKAATKAATKTEARPVAEKKAGRISPDILARAAYLNYRRRVENSLPGDANGDWLEAERRLQEVTKTEQA
ncbi:MAG: hypothetical protein QM680_06425 [Luteolibacter sp.]